MNRLLILLLFLGYTAKADDGYRLWLKYDLIKDGAKREAYARSAQFISVKGNSPILKTAAAELQTGLQGLLGKTVPILANAGTRAGGILLTVSSAPSTDGKGLNKEGYRITKNQAAITIASPSDAGVSVRRFCPASATPDGAAHRRPVVNRQSPHSASDAEPLG